MSEPIATDPRTRSRPDQHRSTRRAASGARCGVHFYSGMFALPFILLMAVTGLVILYTDPIQQLTEGDVRSVEAELGRVPVVRSASCRGPGGVPGGRCSA